MSVPRVVKSLGWVSLFTDAASEMIYPLLPAFLKSLGGGAASLGLMEGVAESVSALVKWHAGRMTDRAPQKKPLIVLGYGVATFVRPLIALAMSPLQVVLLRTLDRIGKGLRGAPRDALVAQAVAPSERAAAFGFHRMMDNAGSVLGPILAFALLRGLGLSLRAVFALALVPGLAALLTLVFGVREEAPADAQAPANAGAGHAPMLDGAPLPAETQRYISVLAIFTLGASADSFLLLRAVEIGLAEWLVPVLWLTLGAAKALTNVPGGRLADRFGRRRALVAAWVVYALAYAAFPLTRSVTTYWALIVLYGLYYGLAEGSEKALLADYAPKAQRGRAYGSMHAVTGLVVLPANALFGLLYTYDPRYAFGFGAACALVAAVALASLRDPAPGSIRA